MPGQSLQFIHHTISNWIQKKLSAQNTAPAGSQSSLMLHHDCRLSLSQPGRNLFHYKTRRLLGDDSETSEVA